MKSKIGQHLIIGLAGYELTKNEADFIVENNIGGVVLFTRNVNSPEQLAHLTGSIQALRHKMSDKAPLFISIDMEGGRVLRLKAPFTPWPPLRLIGQLDSTSVAFKFAYGMGREMRAVGINLDFAPSVDVFTNPENKVIGDRSLSSDPEIVSKLASALVRGYIKADILPCAKHFPGHGNTLVDSHADLPVEEKDLAALEATELVPFRKCFKARMDLVMSSHIKFENVDPEWPVTLSRKFLTDILRTDLRFRGLVITDDLDMGAMIKHYSREVIPVRALQAGANILLYCNDPTSPVIAMGAIEKAVVDGTLSREQIEAGHQAILELKKTKIPNPDPLPTDEIAKIVGHADHLRLAQAVRDGSVPANLLES